MTAKKRHWDAFILRAKIKDAQHALSDAQLFGTAKRVARATAALRALLLEQRAARRGGENR